MAHARRGIILTSKSYSRDPPLQRQPTTETNLLRLGTWTGNGHFLSTAREDLKLHYLANQKTFQVLNNCPNSSILF